MSLRSRSGRLVVLCPSQAQTGGPEALHQLVDACRRQGYDARICYYPKVGPVVYAYTHYHFPILALDEIQESDHLVIPETDILAFLEKNPWAKAIRKHMWWLSWDNFRGDIDSIKKIPRLNHLAQSVYAKNQVESHGLGPTSLLGDYIRDVFFKKQSTKAVRKDVILFNPSKGFYWTQKLKELLPSVKWVALKGLTPGQVRKTMHEAKVYVDFGHGPGLDRFPREALMSGLAVITSHAGAFGVKEDWNLPDAFKFNLPKVLEADVGREVALQEQAELEKAATVIGVLLKNHEQMLGQYAFVINQIKKQKKTFFDQALHFCEKGSIARLNSLRALWDPLHVPFRRFYTLAHPLTWTKRLKKIERKARCFLRQKD